MLLEGVLLGVIVMVTWIYIQKKGKQYLGLSGLVFAIGYGVSRIFAEFFRLPDAHIGYIAFGFVTMGQILTLVITLIGAISILWLRRGSTQQPLSSHSSSLTHAHK